MTIANMKPTAAAVIAGLLPYAAMAAAAQVAMESDYSGPCVLREPRRKTAAGKVGGVILAPRLGRNEPCHCGSGRKYKRCCGG